MDYRRTGWKSQGVANNISNSMEKSNFKEQENFAIITESEC